MPTPDHIRAPEQSGPDAALQDALPHLDAALHALPRDDQRIVLMRYFEGRGLRDIAAGLGKTEAAVRKRGQRALEKMARYLQCRGVGTSTAVFAAGLGVVLSEPASAAAVSAISTNAPPHTPRARIRRWPLGRLQLYFSNVSLTGRPETPLK